MIAFQIGNEISLPELGTKLGIDKNTVERYLNLLTKVFVLYKVNLELFTFEIKTTYSHF